MYFHLFQTFQDFHNCIYDNKTISPNNEFISSKRPRIVFYSARAMILNCFVCLLYLQKFSLGFQNVSKTRGTIKYIA